MNRFRVLLALCFGCLFCASSVFARGSLSTWPHANNPIADAAAEACTLDVVLITFRDTTVSSSTNTYQYHDYDRPHGEGTRGTGSPTFYRLNDFLRMLAGGYPTAEGGHPTAFVGSNLTVAGGNVRLPEVFGSVRAYFDEMSGGAFELHVRMVNPQNADGFPRWIELPASKEHYAERARGDEFWDAAHQATTRALASWNLLISLPHHNSTSDYPFSRLLRRKILFLYSGPYFDNPRGVLHPRADWITLPNPTQASHVGYRYVMSEHQGFKTDSHGLDRFAGIGTHAHEIGHLLGLNHGEGNWTDSVNRYGNSRTNNPPNEVRRGANHVPWTLMQVAAGQGPGEQDDGYWLPYASCPNPINPFTAVISVGSRRSRFKALRTISPSPPAQRI